MKRLVWLESAQLDLLDIQGYYAEKASRDIAAKLLQKIYASANTLLEQPFIGTSTADDDILEWHIPNVNYTLPYMINGNDIEILRVFHQSQSKPSKWESE